MVPMKDLDDLRRKFDRELKTGLLGMLLLKVIDRSEEPLYGYRIIKEVDRMSNGDFLLPEGTVYPILNSLESSGLLESKWGKGKEGPRRKYYSITEKGRQALSGIIAEWRSVSATIEKMIGDEGVSE